jgi:glutamine cyclotransferase
MRKTDADSSGHTMAQRRGAQALRVGGVVGLALTALVIALVARHGALTERADAGPSGVTQSSSRLGARAAAAAATRDSLATPRQIVRPPEPRRASEKEYAAAAAAGTGTGTRAASRAGAARDEASPSSPAPPPKTYSFSVVRKFPHDPFAFTQGLVFLAPDTLFESTGSVGGPSTVREVDLTTGAVRNRRELSREHFAEGLALVSGGAELAQITWRSGRGFRYDRTTLEPIEAFDTPLEDGWGLTVDPHDENRWIVTDASEHMRFVERPRGAAEDDEEGEDSDSRVASSRLALAESVPVRDGDRSIRFTNELETIGEEVWANVIETECIARVDPRSGAVVGWVDMTGLRDALDPGAPTKAGVLNGIAADEKSGRIFVTGKNWPNLFEVTVHETDADLEEVRKTCWPPMSLPQYGYP